MTQKVSKHASQRLKGRMQRQRRVRQKVRGTDTRPRLCVFKSLKYTYAQLISDESGKILVQSSSRSSDGSSKGVYEAKEVGKRLAEAAKERAIENVIFDRNGYRYHGRVAAVAEGAREAGLVF